MNHHSSRSHSVFTLNIQSRVGAACCTHNVTNEHVLEQEDNDGTITERYSRFSLIDLAGSERQTDTGATGYAEHQIKTLLVSPPFSCSANAFAKQAKSTSHCRFWAKSSAHSLREPGDETNTSITVTPS